MDRRTFLKDAGIVASAMGLGLSPTRLLPAEEKHGDENVNWIDPALHVAIKASSYVADPPWGYVPSNLYDNDPHVGWEADQQTQGAWLEITFPEFRPIGELWILAQPVSRDVVGQDPYMLTYSRTGLRANPRKIRFSLSSGFTLTSQLRQTDIFQIIPFPEIQKTASIRILIEDVWSKPGAVETGLGKIRAFPRRHSPSFEIDAWPMYDVRDGKAVQAATLHFINPGAAVTGTRLQVSSKSKVLMEASLTTIPGYSVSHQEIWIPAPLDDMAMDFTVGTASVAYGTTRSLQVPAYRSYFSHGTFSIHCTSHNDLGWLNTQEKTADYRSAEIILPALKLLEQYPEFRYSMECTAYLMEFLERHPERRQEMISLMQDKRFAWGASFVECQNVHVGPEKLVRQFYLGRRWLKTTFPGVDTRFYIQTDPPEMTLQLPQILKRAGIKYYIQGRMPFGFYHWEAPDGSSVLTYAYHYGNPIRLLNPKGNQGWLSYGHEREYYYAARQLPHNFIYDYTGDYLPPQPALPPYVRAQNEAMRRFAENRKQHHRRISPPVMNFVTAESFLDDFTSHPLNIPTLKGDWPFSWTYYDEPSNREAILAGREAHNRLLMAERLFAGLSLDSGFGDYPAKEFAEAWRANCWPDHGWGGNRGTITDSVYRASYEKSKELADKLLESAGLQLVKRLPRKATTPTLAVFNPLNWERSDVVHATMEAPPDWKGIIVRDAAGRELPCELSPQGTGTVRIAFIAESVPPLGYCTYALEPSDSPAKVEQLDGREIENDFFKVVFGDGGVKRLHDKRLKWEVFRTNKFDGGEVIQFTAPGKALEGRENVTMDDFDRTSHHAFPIKALTRTAIRTTAVREATFKHFMLRERFHLYHALDRLDIDLELVNWDGQQERELCVVFPVNLDTARTSYEVPFGTVEMGKDELNFSLLPEDPNTAFHPDTYGGTALPVFREAINWIDASSQQYSGHGCLCASDSTVHLFRDETIDPVSYPVLQHVLLSTRKSLAWNPDYWFTQEGTHGYRMAVLPHRGDWRLRYREAIGFNYPLAAFPTSGDSLPGNASPAMAFFHLEPKNLCLSALKKGEDGNSIIIRFFEAEGFKTLGTIYSSKPIRSAWRTSLIEDDEAPIGTAADGSLQLSVSPWEIATLKLMF